MNKALRKYMSELGKKGRAAFEKKYTPAQRREWTKRGGRPRKARVPPVHKPAI